MFNVRRVREYWGNLEFVPTDEGIEFHPAACESCGQGAGPRFVMQARLKGDSGWSDVPVCGDCFGYLVNDEVPDNVVVIREYACFRTYLKRITWADAPAGVNLPTEFEHDVTCGSWSDEERSEREHDAMTDAMDAAESMYGGVIESCILDIVDVDEHVERGMQA